MGTPEFAVPALTAIVGSEYPVIAVVTQPDRPKGRGQKPAASPVKTAAEHYRLPILQPERVRDEAFLKIFRGLSPDVVVLVAFGQILPTEIIRFPKMGCINIHPSLLPKYRGAAPINWTLIRGEEKTGVTIMMMDEGVDSGDILLQEETTVEHGETYNRLHDRLAIMGADLLLKTLEGLTEGTIQPLPQNAAMATYAPRLKKEDGLIQWQSEVKDIVNRIAGLSPTPGAYTFMNGKMLKLFAAEGEETMVMEEPGALLGKSDRGMKVAAINGYVHIKELQLEGRKRMTSEEFLKGYRIKPGDKLISQGPLLP